MEPAVIPVVFIVDIAMVEPDIDDTTRVDGITTEFAESVEHRTLLAVMVDAVRIDETVALFETSVDPDTVE